MDQEGKIELLMKTKEFRNMNNEYKERAVQILRTLDGMNIYEAQSLLESCKYVLGYTKLDYS